MAVPDDPESPGDWSRLIEGLKTGDADVMRRFYDRYRPTLYLIADRRVRPTLQRRFDADDVVQSTLRTFFRRVQSGSLEIEDDQRMWNLLCAMTLTKLREKVRYHTRMRRAIHREFGSDSRPGSSGRPPLEDPQQKGDPIADLEFVEAFEAVLASLPDSDRRVVELKLRGCSTSDIAAEFQSSERTIQRRLGRLQKKFESALAPPN